MAGKTGSRTVALEQRTMELLKEYADDGPRKGSVFNFNSANSLRHWLNRQIEKVRLPKESTIDVKHFQSHNLRASKLTWLNTKEGFEIPELMKFSGHRDVNTVAKYIRG